VLSKVVDAKAAMILKGIAKNNENNEAGGDGNTDNK
jgi:hypothetical protein